MMRRLGAVSLSIALTLVAGCAVADLPAGEDKPEPTKGEVDDTPPTGDPSEQTDWSVIADVNPNVIAYSKESAHPYANNANQTFTLDLASVVPACATQVRVHFATLRTEANYDYVHVLSGTGSTVQSFTGTHDNVWSNWATLSSTKRMSLRLVSDYSITRDGFRVDAIEWRGQVTCPLSPVYQCTANQVDLRRPAPACGCEETSHCTPLSSVTVTHSVGGGFTGQMTGHKTVGTTVSTTTYMPNTGDSSTAVGVVDAAALRAFLLELAATGVLYGPGRAESSNWNECFTVTTDQESVSYCAAAGSHTAAVTAAIDAFKALVSCNGSMTCNSGYTCDAGGNCATSGCICPAIYDPQCGVDGRTYSSGCAAACANASIKHAGECGIAGDACGGIAGIQCADGFKCRYASGQYTAPYPDAGGSCVAQNYCDAPPDCAELIHPAVPGAWGCVANQCQWQAGPAWRDLSGWQFETTHPYGNNVAVWKQLYLPSGATKMRLAMAGVFELESGYDFLEVWTWKNGAWARVARYTGAVGPSASEEFAGQYHQLRLVTDSSVTKYGFNLLAQYQ